jgi:glutamine synthetase type III
VHSLMTSKTTAKLHENRMNHLDQIFGKVLSELEKFETLVEKSQKIHDEEKRMWDIVETVQPATFKLRAACDEAEKIIANELWPLPKYREILLANTLA